MFLGEVFTAALSAAHIALVYRGPAACDGCPEAIAHLLRTSPTNFDVRYVGPKEELQLNASTLQIADLYAQPGGGGVAQNWPHLKPQYDSVRDFVANGGIYLGHCLGAYFAGRPGFNILPEHWNTNEECIQPGAQVKNRKNTVIQIDYTWGTGPKAGKTADGRWVFFQDGSVMLPHKGAVNESTVRGNYSANHNIAMTITPWGKGWVAATGVHVEATRSWYTHGNKNPDGYGLEIGHDWIETVMKTWRDGL